VIALDAVEPEAKPRAVWSAAVSSISDVVKALNNTTNSNNIGNAFSLDSTGKKIVVSSGRWWWQSRRS
jgi:hypothetical protein